MSETTNELVPVPKDTLKRQIAEIVELKALLTSAEANEKNLAQSIIDICEREMRFRQSVADALAALRAEIYDYAERMSRTLSGDAAKDWLKKIDATIAALDLPVAKEKANG